MSLSTYRIAFPAGFRPLVECLAKRDFGSSSLIDADESSLTIRPNIPYRVPAYAQNSSLVIDIARCSGLEEAFRLFASRARDGNPRQELSRAFRDKAFMRTGRANRFVVRGFMRSTPSFPGAEARNALETVISRISSAEPDSSHPDVELSVVFRDDGNAYFTAAFQSGKTEQTTEAGELPRQTARLLCELSEPSAQDVFLDPFMGSGSLPLERARMGAYKLIFASDHNETLVARVKERLKTKDFERKKRTFFPKRLDARDLSRFEDGLFTTIVTDPPWGDWEGLDDAALVDLYAAFLAEAKRVLAPDGRLVLLVGRNDVLERAIAAGPAPTEAERSDSWRIDTDFPVLISGKKARAVLLRRR
ncbi:MAG: RsmD family RNA methyltransferase [Treponemataceae bacterium]